MPFLEKFGPKNPNCQFKLKFGTKTDPNMENSIVTFTFSVLDLKYTFWTNLVQKVKVVSLSWNLVPTLIRTRRTRWWWSFFLFLTQHALFSFEFKMKFGTKTNFKLCKTQWWLSLFLFSAQANVNYHFWSFSINVWYITM